MIKLFKQLIGYIINGLNYILSKKQNQIFIKGEPNNESSAVVIANYIDANYDFTIYYSISNTYNDLPQLNRSDKVKVIEDSGGIIKLTKYYWKLITSKYVFFTHNIPFFKFSNKQVSINVWHGVLYKNVGLLIGGGAINTDITVGTSELTVPMFSKAFGVPEESIFLSGYPRNDIMINAQNNRLDILLKMGKEFLSFDKLIIWLPTFRQRRQGDNRLDGKETGNPFYIPDFDINKFNTLLKQTNTCCIIKPHPMALKYPENFGLSNVVFIDDNWISNKGLLLYELLGVTDLLISDISSVVIDYLLLNNPIICISTDLEEYKQTRGFYFDDIKEWLPNIFEDQDQFLKYLSFLLNDKKDIYTQKREELRSLFFKYNDNKNTERLIEYVFNSKQNNASKNKVIKS